MHNYILSYQCAILTPKVVIFLYDYILILTPKVFIFMHDYILFYQCVILTTKAAIFIHSYILSYQFKHRDDVSIPLFMTHKYS